MAWVGPASKWFQDPTRWDVLLAADGPDDVAAGARWHARAAKPDAASPTPRPAWTRARRRRGARAARAAGGHRSATSRPTPTASASTSSEPACPCWSKASYFPNWKVSGAEGPYRVTPNLMVVVPTDTHVELHYGWTPVDVGSYARVGARHRRAGLPRPSPALPSTGRRRPPLPRRPRARRRRPRRTTTDLDEDLDDDLDDELDDRTSRTSRTSRTTGRAGRAGRAGPTSRTMQKIRTVPVPRPEATVRANLARFAAVGSLVTAVDVGLFLARWRGGRRSVAAADGRRAGGLRRRVVGAAPGRHVPRRPVPPAGCTSTRPSSPRASPAAPSTSPSPSGMLGASPAGERPACRPGGQAARRRRRRLGPLGAAPPGAVPHRRATSTSPGPAPCRCPATVAPLGRGPRLPRGRPHRRHRRAGCASRAGRRRRRPRDHRRRRRLDRRHRRRGHARPAPTRSSCHPANRGKGAAVRAGVLAADGRTVAFTDADLAYSPDQLARAARARSRRAGTSSSAAGATTQTTTLVRAGRLREIGGRVINLAHHVRAARPLPRHPVRLKAFRSDAARAIFERAQRRRLRLRHRGVPPRRAQPAVARRGAGDGREQRRARPCRWSATPPALRGATCSGSGAGRGRAATRPRGRRPESATRVGRGHEWPR